MLHLDIGLISAMLPSAASVRCPLCIENTARDDGSSRCVKDEQRTVLLGFAITSAVAARASSMKAKPIGTLVSRSIAVGRKSINNEK